jgi:hypothetical protein
MLEEFAKIFKRKNVKNVVLVNIIEVLFGLLTSIEQGVPVFARGEKHGTLDNNVAILLSLIEMRQMLMKRLIEAMVDRFQENPI